MKLTRLLSPVFAFTLLFALTGCDREAEKLDSEYTKNVAEGIDDLQKDIKQAPDERGEVPIVPEQVISLTLPVPTPAWSLKIDEAWVVGQELWVIATLSQDTDGMAAQVISHAKASATLQNVPQIPATYFVLGKSFDWEQEMPNVKFIDSKAEIQKGLSMGAQVYPSQVEPL
ncbi:hypothetical protein [Ruficoccus sp. ZRK36]|uniref:hypothetical protein n=1 Tax=Ruficoccus sp. ZRK36 TaxID=2866311 RepID=UPI001C73CFF7|nr:hypothetical protein [Ruficoccus sp. ZRK36]QYY35327.1 hypothetical protein K0V07_13630 [Ruficoccus sp. ZRK36]